MTHYEHEYSHFPERQITLHRFKDMDDSAAPLITQIQDLRRQEKHEEASRLVQENAKILAPYTIGASTVNTMIEEIYNTQIYAKHVQQSVFTDTEEPSATQSSDVWVGGK